MAQPDIHFSVLVDVRCLTKATRRTMQVEDSTLANVDEEPDVTLTPTEKVKLANAINDLDLL